ncbi:MAG: 3-phosphoshikimate 1-carboxyvinyltransferase [Bacteroidales bacterium]|nr:3-phosphoshikimate 1-carboxyvinyltransferase [Bacteroidales bacterium]MDD4604234.1 3-phosphoshikimate 1-carboxyvinyltransferase [Bacteroidales bacterium]
MKSIVITKSDKVLRGNLVLPASKSISNRLLIIRALGGKDIDIRNLSDAADTLLLTRLLENIDQTNGLKKVVELDTNTAGTVMRFLTAYLSLQPGHWVLTGSDRMKQRPIYILVEALQSLGASIDYLAKLGYPPILIKGTPFCGSEVAIDPGVSSQFGTALLLIAPYLPHGLVLQYKGPVISSPYIQMTIRLMKYFGARIKAGKTRIHVQQGNYKPRTFLVEADWSAAAFWYEAAVFAEEVDLDLQGLYIDSLQGDSILPEIYQNFGIRTDFTSTGVHLSKTHKKMDGFSYDFTDYPDIAPSVIATCAGLGIRGRFEGLKTLRIKESDRLLALKHEIEKFGSEVEISVSMDLIQSLEFKSMNTRFLPDLSFESYGDHRMAMTFAPFALKSGRVRIINPEVVAKSYPRFWEHLVELGFVIH